MKTKISFLLLLLLAMTPYWSVLNAQPLVMNIQPSSGTTEDIYVLTLTTRTEKVQYPELAGGADFDISYLGTQQSIQIINGVTTRETTFRYQLRPKHTGQLLSPSASLGAYVAQAQVVEVKEPEKGAKRRDSMKGEVAFRQSVTPKEVFVGQQLVHQVDLMTHLPTVNLRMDDQSLEGFWQIKFPDALSGRRSIGGKIYDVTSIRNALFPIKAGTYTIPKRKAIFEVRLPNPRNPIDLFNFDPFSMSPFQAFTGTTREIQAHADPVTIEVKPLPQGPADIVGLASLSTDVESMSIEAGKSFTISFTLVSDGQLDGIKELKDTKTNGLQVFWDKPSAEHFENRGRLFTRKKFMASIVGVVPGLHTVEIEPFRVFDPDKKHYRTLSIKPVVVSVGGDIPQSQKAAPLPADIPDSENLNPPLKAGFSSAVIIYVALAFLVVGLLLAALWFHNQAKAFAARCRERISQATDLDSASEIFLDISTNIFNIPRDKDLREEIQKQVSQKPSELNFRLQRAFDLLEELKYSPRKDRLDELKAQLSSLLDKT